MHDCHNHNKISLKTKCAIIWKWIYKHRTLIHSWIDVYRWHFFLAVILHILYPNDTHDVVMYSHDALMIDWLCLTILWSDKTATIFRGNFQIHILVWNLFYFDSQFNDNGRTGANHQLSKLWSSFLTVMYITYDTSIRNLGIICIHYLP